MMIPEMTDLRNWAASLITDFPEDDIPLLDNEQNWKDWGDRLSQCSTFIQNNSPGTQHYDTWEKWSNRVFFCMNNN